VVLEMMNAKSLLLIIDFHLCLLKCFSQVWIKYPLTNFQTEKKKAWENASFFLKHSKVKNSIAFRLKHLSLNIFTEFLFNDLLAIRDRKNQTVFPTLTHSLLYTAYFISGPHQVVSPHREQFSIRHHLCATTQFNIDTFHLELESSL
jgi:hypothetical protein